MTTDNTRFWNQLASTDPAHIKPIAGKRYRGMNIKAEYRMQKMTEAFGPAGEGWGWIIENRWREDFPVTIRDAKTQAERVEQRPFVFVQIGVWWRGPDGEKHQVGSTIGGTAIEADADDAYKKAITDALGKCLAALGCCADVYLGYHDGLPQGGPGNQRTESRRPEGQRPASRRPEKPASPPATSRQQPFSDPPHGVWDAYISDIKGKLASCKTPGCASKVRRSIEDDLAAGRISQPTHAAAVAFCKPRYDELVSDAEGAAQRGQPAGRPATNREPSSDGPRLVRDDEAPPLDESDQADADFLEAFRGLIETTERVGAISAERKKLRSMGLSPATVAAAERICDAAMAVLNKKSWATSAQRRAVSA